VYKRQRSRPTTPHFLLPLFGTLQPARNTRYWHAVLTKLTGYKLQDVAYTCMMIDTTQLLSRSQMVKSKCFVENTLGDRCTQPVGVNDWVDDCSDSGHT